MNYYFGVFKKYAVFNGRARRKEYWMFSLFNFIIFIIFYLIIIFSGNIFSDVTGHVIRRTVYYLSFLYSAAVIVPHIAVAVRRLHDINRNGWWYFIGLIPIIGPMVLFVFFATDSTSGENKYGLNPKGTIEIRNDLEKGEIKQKMPVGIILFLVLTVGGFISTIVTFKNQFFQVGPFILTEAMAIAWNVIFIILTVFMFFGILKKFKWARILTICYYFFSAILVVANFIAIKLSPAVYNFYLDYYKKNLTTEGIAVINPIVIITIIFASLLIYNLVFSVIVIVYFIKRKDYFVN